MVRCHREGVNIAFGDACWFSSSRLNVFNCTAAFFHRYWYLIRRICQYRVIFVIRAFAISVFAYPRFSFFSIMRSINILAKF
jgi:hypothetical protein